MELPSYSSQLMQQLWTLRKEGHFCDCTILVGETPHRAHKLLLAASSMLFRYPSSHVQPHLPLHHDLTPVSGFCLTCSMWRCFCGIGLELQAPPGR